MIRATRGKIELDQVRYNEWVTLAYLDIFGIHHFIK